LISEPVYNIRDFFCKNQHDQVWRIKQFWIIVKEVDRSVGATGHGDGVIKKAIKRHERYRLAGLAARFVETIRFCLDDDVMYHVMDKELLTTI